MSVFCEGNNLIMKNQNDYQVEYTSTSEDRRIRNERRNKMMEKAESKTKCSQHNNNKDGDQNVGQNDSANKIPSTSYISQMSIEIKPPSLVSIGNVNDGGRDVGTGTLSACKLCSSARGVLIVCSVCGGDFCCECVGMNEDAVYWHDRTEGMRWYCGECSPRATDAIKKCAQKETERGDQSQDRLRQLEETVANLQARMINMELNMCKTVPVNTTTYATTLRGNANVPSVAPHSQSNPAHKQTESHPTQARSVTPTQQDVHLSTTAPVAITKKPTLKLKNEAGERERRSKNIVVHNLTESQEKTPADRHSEDIVRVNEMLSEGLRLEIKAVKATRLGAKRNDGKPRVLLIALNSDRARVLRKSRYVRMYEEWQNIFIDPDRTPQERREHDIKRAERRAEREAEESFYSATEGEETPPLIDLSDETPVETTSEPEPAREPEPAGEPEPAEEPEATNNQNEASLSSEPQPTACTQDESSETAPGEHKPDKINE